MQMTVNHLNMLTLQRANHRALIAETTARDIIQPVLATDRANCQHSWANMESVVNSLFNELFGTTGHNCPVGSKHYFQDL